MISIILPIHDMKNGAYFLWRAVNSIMSQTYKDYEIIITKEGRMAENTNAGIKKAKGDIVKILYMDDFLSDPDVLEDIFRAFEESSSDWVITGANNNLFPRWTNNIETGNNKLGSPSALAFRKEAGLLFDENMSWLLDCDLYKRFYEQSGEPLILDGDYITIGEHDGQMTHLLTDEEKMSEHIYLANKNK